MPFRARSRSRLIQVLAQLNYDADAEAYFLAAEITDETQKTAFTKFCLSAKRNGYWDNIVAMYPMFGGTAAKHKFNAKNPVDSDTANRLVFTGTWTHDANGAKSVSGAAADTFVIPNDIVSTYYGTLSYRDQYTSGVAIGANAKDYEYGAATSGQMYSIGKAMSTPQKYLNGCVGVTTENIKHSDFIFNGIPASLGRDTLAKSVGKMTLSAFNGGTLGVLRHKFMAIHKDLTKAKLKLFSEDLIALVVDTGRALTVVTTTKTVASSGADYTSIREALKSCTDANYYNRYIINISNGTYNEIDIYVPATSRTGYDPSMIQIVGESRAGVIISTDGASTDLSPSDYQFGAYGGIAINTIPLANRHTFWMQGSLTLKNLTIHSNDVHYLIHTDAYNWTSFCKYENVTFIHEENTLHGYSCVGYGQSLDQYAEYVNCSFEYRTTLLTANDAWGAFWHNIANGQGGDCSFKMSGCTFINCGYARIDEMQSTFEDVVTIENCSSDTITKAIYYYAASTALQYNITVNVINSGIDADNVAQLNRPNYLTKINFS